MNAYLLQTMQQYVVNVAAAGKVAQNLGMSFASQCDAYLFRMDRDGFALEVDCDRFSVEHELSAQELDGACNQVADAMRTFGIPKQGLVPRKTCTPFSFFEKPHWEYVKSS